MNDIYPLQNIRYFNAYNSETKELEYSKYNFNFEKYKIDYNLQDKTKLLFYTVKSGDQKEILEYEKNLNFNLSWV